MIVRFTPEALDDLKRIGDYIAEDDHDRALSFVAEIEQAHMGPAEFPNGFPLAARYLQTRARRRTPVNYLIFYLVDVDTVSILNVIHGRRDYAALLSAD